MFHTTFSRSVGATLLAGFAIAAATPLQGQRPTTRASTDPPLPSSGKMGQDLFLAIDHRDASAVKKLLKKGADPNSTNGLQFTPLCIAAASHQPDAVEALIAAGAKPDARSTYGSPLTFAAMGGNLEGAQRLLGLGAETNVRRTDGTTPLMMAASSGHPGLVAELLKHGANVNGRNNSKSTALTYAVRGGNADAAKVLLAAGAHVDPIDETGMTPLMIAAQNGDARLVKMLLNEGANINSTNKAGETALILAAEYGDNIGVVSTLLAAGANPKTADAEGMTAADYASARGFAKCATLLGPATHPRKIRDAREAARFSVMAIQKSMADFSNRAACASCHQDGLGRIAMAAAEQHGLRVDPQVEKIERMKLQGMTMAMKPLHDQALKNAEVMKQLPLIEINEVSDSYGWFLSGMAAQGDPATPATAAAAKILARQQSPSGAWTFSLPRIPMQSSNFTVTALAARSLSAYAPKSDRANIAARLAKAKQWLMSAPVRTGDDRAMRLMGLAWTGASMMERRKAISELMAAQNPDGGWSQMPGMRSDAYATGQALYALRIGGGMSPTSSVYRKGTGYLLRTQDRDGTWYVGKRAMPANNYFDSGFPHGESQYASFNATCWATMALLEASAAR